jgi:hypothetical protein
MADNAARMPDEHNHPFLGRVLRRIDPMVVAGANLDKCAVHQIKIARLGQQDFERSVTVQPESSRILIVVWFGFAFVALMSRTPHFATVAQLLQPGIGQGRAGKVIPSAPNTEQC